MTLILPDNRFVAGKGGWPCFGRIAMGEQGNQGVRVHYGGDGRPFGIVGSQRAYRRAGRLPRRDQSAQDVKRHDPGRLAGPVAIQFLVVKLFHNGGDSAGPLKVR